jgi:hypothetical protein
MTLLATNSCFAHSENDPSKADGVDYCSKKSPLQKSMKAPFDGVQPILWAFNRVSAAPPSKIAEGRVARSLSYLRSGSGRDFENIRSGGNHYEGPNTAATAVNGMCGGPAGATERLWPIAVQPSLYNQGHTQLVFATLAGAQAHFSTLPAQQKCYAWEEGSVMETGGSVELGLAACGAGISAQMRKFGDKTREKLGFVSCPRATRNPTAVVDSIKQEDGASVDALDYFHGWLMTGGKNPTASPNADAALCAFGLCKAPTAPNYECRTPASNVKLDEESGFAARANSTMVSRLSLSPLATCRND